MKKVLILGATSDIALAVANELARKKYDLILTGRNEEELKKSSSDLEIRFGIKTNVLKFDALVQEQYIKALKKSEEIGYDGVVLAYGYLGEQLKGQTNIDEQAKILTINYLSAVHMLEISANYLEKKKSGFICAISSVAGDRGRQSNYLYGSAKGGLTIYLQGLRNRLFHHGVHVITVKPGFVATKMTKGIVKDSPLVSTPEKVAKDIISAIEKRKNTIYSMKIWKLIMMIICFVPEKIFKRLKL